MQKITNLAVAEDKLPKFPCSLKLPLTNLEWLPLFSVSPYPLRTGACFRLTKDVANLEKGKVMRIE